MYAAQQNRTASALASTAIVAGIGAMLLFGLQAGAVQQATDALVAVNLLPPRPSPKPTPTPPPKVTQKSAPKGDPGQRNLKNKATQIVAVKPPIVIVTPPPVVVATTPANVGNATQSGASDRAAPGQGAGGHGSGLGGGGNGGNGDGVNREAPPRPIRDRLAYKYIPDDVGEPGETVSLGVVYLVNPDGHVSNCKVDRSSGYPRFDRYACQLIEERFLFRPARDRTGKAISTRVGQDHFWEIPRDVDRGR
jgi:protein TonB